MEVILKNKLYYFSGYKKFSIKEEDLSENDT